MEVSFLDMNYQFFVKYSLTTLSCITYKMEVIVYTQTIESFQCSFSYNLTGYCCLKRNSLTQISISTILFFSKLIFVIQILESCSLVSLNLFDNLKLSSKKRFIKSTHRLLSFFLLYGFMKIVYASFGTP